MSAADLQHRMHRHRSADELRADLIAGCASLGRLATSWHAAGFVPDRDLTALDHALVGLNHVMVALRAAGVADAA